jgi:hypothetical protein
MLCDKAGAILGVMKDATKNYVMRGQDRVMSWLNGVSQRRNNNSSLPAQEWKMWN